MSSTNQSEFTKGEKVVFAPEWSEGDSSVFVVVGEDEGKGRVDIAPIEWNHGLVIPVETVRTFMIRKV